MAKRAFSKSPHYVQSVQGLHRLHALVVANQDETPEADAVRDSLDQPWYLLSEVEKERITGLSEDLYSLSDPPKPPLAMNPQAQTKLMEADESRQAGEWDQALGLLRRWGRYVDPALLSYLRGGIWFQAGDYATAALFFEHAAKLEPANGSYASLHLHSLEKSVPTTALERAQEILASDETHPPAAVVMAGEIRFESTRGMADVDARPIVQELVEVLERLLDRSQNTATAGASSFGSTHVMTLTLLGYSYSRLGDSRAALRYYNAGLKADPENTVLLIARGIRRYGVDQGAKDDFEQAIRHGSNVVAPYFYLAHYYLVTNRFEECRKMSERALEFAPPEEVRAYLQEWLAISKDELGFPKEQVRAAFEAAIRLAPDNERIRQNFEVFEQAPARPSISPRNWSKPKDSAVQALGQLNQPVLSHIVPLLAA